MRPRRGALAVAGVVALGATAGFAAAAVGPQGGHGHRDRTSLAPVDPTDILGQGGLRAGFVQHAPVNLGSLKPPRPWTGVQLPDVHGRSLRSPAAVSRATSHGTLAVAGAVAGGVASPSSPTAGRGPGRGGRPTLGPVDVTRTHGPGQQHTGFVQHAPSNLGGLKPPAPRAQSQGAPAGSAATAARRLAVSLAAAAIPPAPSITSGPTNPTYALSASFTFTDTASPVTYQCRLDGAAFSSCTSGISYAGPLAFGSHTFRVRAQNASGSSFATLFTWTVSAPPAPTLTAQPANPSTSQSASFSFTDSLAGVTFQCSLDGAGFAACTSPAAYAGPLAFGSHTFRVRARNAGGAGAATTYAWSVVPPAPTITSGPANPTTSTSAAFSFTDTLSGATFQCSLDAAAFAACTSPASYTGLAVGSHTFRVRAVSGAGTSAATSYAWSITPPPPPAPTLTQQPANPTGSTTAAFAFTDTDATATFECSLDNAAFAACTSPTSYSALATGSHTFQVRARNAGGTSGATAFTWTIVPLSVKMKLLVVSADGKEQFDFASNSGCVPSPCKGAIQTYLDQLGVPYDTLIASTQVTSASQLTSLLQSADGLTGNYYGVILATGNLGYVNGSGQYVSALTADEWTALWAYEAKFHVRQVTSYTYPAGAPDDYGLQIASPDHQDTSATPLAATLTSAGQKVFADLNPSATITFTNAWVYLATMKSPADPSVTPLLTTSNGYVIASTRAYADGRENLALTAPNAPWLLHTKLLAYGIVNWVTRGVFLGSRHVGMDVQIDDLLIDSDMWDPTTHSDAAGTSTVAPYRLGAADFLAAISWQNAVRSSNPNLAQTRLEWAFNGEGAYGSNTSPPDFTAQPGANSPYAPDALTPEVVKDQANFCYINHTYTHQNVDLTSVAASQQEIAWNQQAAAALGLGCYSNQKFVQPDISGLTNTNFLQAAWDAGVRYLITDTSQPGWSNPSPNTGFLINDGRAAGESLFAIPRHPSNLFYNLRTPAQFVDEYNWYYWTGSPSTSAWKIWPNPLTYAQIVDLESNNLLSYLLSWDIDPWMFHQANLGLYDGQHSLLGDLLSATLQKYTALYNLPVVNMTEDQVGQAMQQRMAYNASGAVGTLVPCQSVTLTVQTAAAVPVTGVTAGSTETYGGQPISTVQVAPGSPVTIPVTCG